MKTWIVRIRWRHDDNIVPREFGGEVEFNHMHNALWSMSDWAGYAAQHGDEKYYEVVRAENGIVFGSTKNMSAPCVTLLIAAAITYESHRATLAGHHDDHVGLWSAAMLALKMEYVGARERMHGDDKE